MGLTFKRGPKQTGLAAVGEPYASVEVKWDNKKIGSITGPTWTTKDNKWSVGFTVKTDELEEHPSGWKWIFMKARFDNEDEARQFVKDNIGTIMQRYKIYALDY